MSTYEHFLDFSSNLAENMLKCLIWIGASAYLAGLEKCFEALNALVCIDFLFSLFIYIFGVPPSLSTKERLSFGRHRYSRDLAPAGSGQKQ